METFKPKYIDRKERHMTRRDLQVRLSERQASGKLCAVSHCYNHVQGIGRYCHSHDEVDKRTGHPLGRTITEREVKTYRDLARSFIEGNIDHPGVEAGIEWLQRLMKHAVAPHTITNNTPPQSRAAQWLEKMERECVDPIDLLATVVAMHVLQEINPRMFMSDRHFRHQLATKFFRLTVSPMRPNGKSRQVIAVRMKDYMADRLNKALGLLSWKIRDQVIKEMSKPEPDAPVSGADIPFTTNTKKET